MIWDVVVVGAGPAGSAAALGALAESPSSKVLLLDRSELPRDKACGDGIAPHVLDVLDTVGVRQLLDDWTPLTRLHLRHGRSSASGTMRRPVHVVPRTVFDHRLLERAVAAGAVFRRHRVRGLTSTAEAVDLDGEIRARLVIAADGAHSRLRRTIGGASPRATALAIRGYAPPPADRRGRQVIVFGRRHQPAYAWSFDRGDGLANVGYGQLLDPRRDPPSRASLLRALEDLLPGATDGAGDWRGHPLPLSGWTWRHPGGRVLLAGDAAGLVNPMTGEGIYYAVATGVLAGRTAAASMMNGADASAGTAYRSAVRGLLAGHLRHTATASKLVSSAALLRAGVGAAARDRQVFHDLVELGLGDGRITFPVVRGLVRQLPRGGPDR